MVEQRGVDWALCEALARRGAEGDAAASRALVEHLWPSWLEHARHSRSMGSLAQSDDHVHEIATKLAEKLCERQGTRLRSYLAWRERNPDKNFADWMRIVTKNEIRDFVREQLGSRALPHGEISRKRLLNEFASSPAVEELGHRPPFTLAQTSRQLMEFAATRLSKSQFAALELWLEGSEFDEIDQRLGVEAGDGQKLMRAGIAVLRRHFGPSSAR